HARRRARGLRDTRGAAGPDRLHGSRGGVPPGHEAAMRRMLSIAAADVRIRFRRTSTVVVFLLLSGLAYLWVPAPSTGRALMIVNGRRALYNSAAIAMATSLLGALFVGLAGFYVVSNAVSRDARSRVGSIIA